MSKRQHGDEVKLGFLAAAIEDVSSHIHTIDGKVAIIVAAGTALLAGVIGCGESILGAFASIPSISPAGIASSFLLVTTLVCWCGLFGFGIATVWNRSYHDTSQSFWFFKPERYDSPDGFAVRLVAQKPQTLLKHMSKELYKLNALFQTKNKWCKCAIACFCMMLISAMALALILACHMMA